MNRTLLGFLTVLLTPSLCWASGSGFGYMRELVEPLEWQWFADDDGAAPTASAPASQPAGGLDQDQTVRLRYNLTCTATRVQQAADCADIELGLSYFAGPWSCLADDGQEAVFLDPQAAWDFADGQGEHGTEVPEPLLYRSTTPGPYYEQPAGELRLSLEPALDGLDHPTEVDLALAPNPGRWQPGQRYVFTPHRLNAPAREFPTCDGASLCTRGGPTDPGPAETLRWSLAVPYSSAVDVVDWDGDGRLDLLVGWVLDSPVLFLNVTPPEDESLRFAPGKLLRLDLGNDVHLSRQTAVDWDGDEDLDLIAGSMRGEILLFSNRGDDTFDLPQPLLYRRPDGTAEPINDLGAAVGRDTNTIVDLYDWDGDDRPDLLTVGSRGLLLLWRHGAEADGTVLEGPEEILIDGRSIGTAIGRVNLPRLVDFDGDGKIDLLASRSGGELFVAPNLGTAEHPSFGAPTAVALSGNESYGLIFPDLGDLDGDGRAELVLGSPQGDLRLIPDEGEPGVPSFLGAPRPAWIHGADPAVTGGARVLWEEFALAKIAPRRHDLLVGRPDGRVEVLLGVGPEEQPAFGVVVPVLAGLGADPSPELADLDGDGLEDLVLGLGDGTVELARGLLEGVRWRTFAARQPVTAGGEALDVGGGAVPRVGDLDGDGLPDLVVGSADGRVHLFLGGEAGLLAGGPLQAGGEPLTLAGAASAAVIDWDEDGRADLLVASTAEELYWIRNTGEPGRPELATPMPLVVGGQRVAPAAGARLVATDFDALTCPRDLVFGGVAGGWQIFPGSIPSPPAPAGLVPGDETDALDGEPLPAQPDLLWEPVQPPAAAKHRYEVELATGSDFRTLLHRAASDEGELREQPTIGLSLPDPLEPGRRYFWRVRSFDEWLHPGFWPYPAAGFAVPLALHNPVDGIAAADPAARGRWSFGSWASLKGRDGELEQVPSWDRWGHLEEAVRNPQEVPLRYVLQQELRFDAPPLFQAAYDLVLVGGTAGDEEELQVQVHEGGDVWTALGSFAGEVAEHTWTLDPAKAIQEGVLRIRIVDSTPDPTPTVAVLDYLAAVLQDAPPVADAGPDGTVGEEEAYTLDGSGSRPGEDDQELTFAWEQLGGPAVALDDAASDAPTFTAPRVLTATELRFRLIVASGPLYDADTVTVLVENTINEAPELVLAEQQAIAECQAGVLDGSASSDPNGDPLTFRWEVTEGPAGLLVLDDPTSATPGFTAPAVDATTRFLVKLTIGDGTDEVSEDLLLSVEDTGQESCEGEGEGAEGEGEGEGAEGEGEGGEVDGGTPDSGDPDGGSDLGPDVPHGGTPDEGCDCSCRLTPRQAPSSGLGVLLLLAGLLWVRRR